MTKITHLNRYFFEKIKKTSIFVLIRIEKEKICGWYNLRGSGHPFEEPTFQLLI